MNKNKSYNVVNKITDICLDWSPSFLQVTQELSISCVTTHSHPFSLELIPTIITILIRYAGHRLWKMISPDSLPQCILDCKFVLPYIHYSVCTMLSCRVFIILAFSMCCLAIYSMHLVGNVVLPCVDTPCIKCLMLSCHVLILHAYSD